VLVVGSLASACRIMLAKMTADARRTPHVIQPKLNRRRPAIAAPIMPPMFSEAWLRDINGPLMAGICSTVRLFMEGWRSPTSKHDSIPKAAATSGSGTVAKRIADKP